MNIPLTLTFLCAALCGGCGGGQAVHPESQQTYRGGADHETFSSTMGTIGITDVVGNGPVATLIALDAHSHSSFDRVVFTFADGDTVPGYHLEYIDKPAHDCGSGDERFIAGDAWLEVRMYPANAHTEEGQPTIPFRQQALNLPLLRELNRTCDFEAVTTWVLGLAAPNAYRVQALADPPRLVVDIAHTGSRARP